KQGGFKWKPILKILSIIEKYTYALSTKVVTIDSHFSEVISPRLASQKLECIPNFIDTELYSPYHGNKSLELNFEGKFLIGYVGNLGKVQDWDALFETALLCQKNPKIAFLIVGGGSEFERLKSFEKKLNNWTVWSYQPRDKVPEINSRIDIHIISMNEASDYDGLPSKVFAILSSGRPILAATNQDSPLSKLILKSGNGLVVERSNPQAIAKGIELSLNGFFNEKKSREGRDFVVKNFSKEVITKQYVNLLDSLLLTS
ncbi:MAG TPA: glycosyltransferase family 4 protein, partial [Roseivirga sp.]